MLTDAASSVPMRVEALFGPDERVIASLTGLLESGLCLTDRRIVGWRANGVGGPVPLATIDRILVDTGQGSGHLDILVLPRQAVYVALVLNLRTNQIAQVLRFVEAVIEAKESSPVRERWGPILRVSFKAEV